MINTNNGRGDKAVKCSQPSLAQTTVNGQQQQRRRGKANTSPEDNVHVRSESSTLSKGVLLTRRHSCVCVCVRLYKLQPIVVVVFSVASVLCLGVHNITDDNISITNTEQTQFRNFMTHVVVSLSPSSPPHTQSVCTSRWCVCVCATSSAERIVRIKPTMAKTAACVAWRG